MQLFLTPFWTAFWTLTDGLSAWLLTYLVHSTLLLGTAALTTRWIRDELALRETIWKTALVGGLVTATLQVGLGVDPIAGSWSVGAVPQPLQATRLETPWSLGEGRTTVDAPAYFLPSVAGGGYRLGRDAAVAQPSLTTSSISRIDAGRRTFALAWLAVAFVLSAGLALSYRRLRWRLAVRRKLTTGSARATLSRLVAASRSRRPADLFASAQISVPLARGLRRREVYLPEGRIAEMSPEQRELVLAHELAHLERRDPAWLLATRMLEAALCAQPLNRIARRELQEIAEYQADDWAVRQTGRPISLAKCLTAIAERAVDPAAWSTAPAMAVDETRLGRRVERLLARDYPRPERPQPRWLVPAALALLASIALVAPGVRMATAAVGTELSGAKLQEAPEAPPEAAATAETPAAPEAPEGLAESATPPKPPSEPTAAPRAIATPSPRPDTVPTPVAPRALPISPIPPVAPVARIDTERLAALAAELAAIESVHLAEVSAEVHKIEVEQIERIAALAAELAELSIPDPATLAAITALATEMTVEIDPAVEARIAILARELATGHELTGEDRQRLQQEMRQLTDSIRPSEEERARLEAEMRELTERARPNAEERERLEREIEAAHREIERHRREIMEGREELRQHRREIEIERRELKRAIREEEREIERRIDSERREIERQVREVQERRRAGTEDRAD